MTPLDILYESVKNRITIDKELFKQNLHNWNAIGLYEKGELIGCVIQRENEVHIGYKAKPTASIRKHLKMTLKKILDEYGSAITYVMENNEKGLNFCKRLGFYEILREQCKIKLKCDRCKYVN
ncbi:MAG: hypothetical protein D0531_01315 [Methylococcales bacterium]|nr:MAG: hypothetical protein D0531_01315 [Methylococcales bacterium]